MTIVFTDYGMTVANNEPGAEPGLFPSSYDAAAIRRVLLYWNTGRRVLLTGINGYQREVTSVLAAFAYAEQNPRIRHAWLLPANDPPVWAPTRGRMLLFRVHP